MRKLTVVVVAAMILLAGCNSGGGGAASPTEDGTDAPATGTTAGGTPTSGSMDGTPMESMTPDGTTNDTSDETTDDTSDETTDGSGSGDISPRSVLASDDPLANATEIDGTTYNGSQQASALLRNDTSSSREFTEYTDESGTTSEVYTAEDYVAVRNGSTGEVEYGGPDSFISSSVEFGAAFTAIGVFFYVDAVEWEPAGTTTVDGETATVFETDSLNETALNNNQNLNLGFEQSEVQSVDGEIVIRSDGRIDSATVEVGTADGVYGGDTSVGYDDITITKPSWVDESQAP